MAFYSLEVSSSVYINRVTRQLHGARGNPRSKTLDGVFLVRFKDGQCIVRGRGGPKSDDRQAFHISGVGEQARTQIVRQVDRVAGGQ